MEDSTRHNKFGLIATSDRLSQCVQRCLSAYLARTNLRFKLAMRERTYAVSIYLLTYMLLYEWILLATEMQPNEKTMKQRNTVKTLTLQSIYAEAMSDEIYLLSEPCKG